MPPRYEREGLVVDDDRQHQVAARPEAVAVEFGEQRLTYRELDAASNRLAHVLRARGVGPDSRVALALDNSRLYEQQRRLAEELQRSMLTEPPQPDHAEIVVRYLPAVQAAEVGGDWYDAFLSPDGATTLVVGDVTGHDRIAAAVMGQLRNMLRGIVHALDAPPACTLTTLDRALRDLGMTTLVTALLARVEQRAEEAAAGVRTLRWSNAGHLPPLLLRADGAAQLLERKVANSR